MVKIWQGLDHSVNLKGKEKQCFYMNLESQMIGMSKRFPNPMLCQIRQSFTHKNLISHKRTFSGLVEDAGKIAV